jgi:formylglycine-generating enzyme required for sulfatase activity
MKHILLLATVVLLTAATGKWKLEDKTIGKTFVHIPAGTLNGTEVKEFYISKIEITNKQYRDFLKSMYESHRYEKWRDARVDTAQWRTYLTYNDPYANHYFQNPEYDIYPVVNISHRGAQLYCEWLTENYNKTAKQKVEFRLPTEAEWMWAAKGGDKDATYPWEGDSLTYQKKGKYYGYDLANYKHYNALALTVDKTTGKVDLTAPSLSFLPNKYDVWNMAGNVAEMTTDPSYTKGGGWADEAPKIKIEHREKYDGKPSPNVGFRPIVVLKQ